MLLFFKMSPHFSKKTYDSRVKEAFEQKELEFAGELESLKNRGRFEAWLDELVSNEWVVYSKAPFGSSEDVVRYVGRYTHDNRLL